MKLANCSKNSRLIIPSHPFLFIRVQEVRGLGQLFEDLSSDLPFPCSSRKHVDLVNCFLDPSSDYPLQDVRELCQMFENSSFDHPLFFFFSSVNLFMTSNLIILSHSLHPSPERIGQLFEYLSSDYLIPSSPGCTWTWSAVWIPSSDHPIPPSSFVSRMYVNMINCLNALHLIIPSSSSISRKYLNVWIILRPLMWFSFPSSSSVSRGRMSTWPIRLNTPHLIVLSRAYVNYLNCLNTPHPLSSPGCTWSRSIVWIFLIWSSYPILFILL